MDEVGANCEEDVHRKRRLFISRCGRNDGTKRGSRTISEKSDLAGVSCKRSPEFALSGVEMKSNPASGGPVGGSTMRMREGSGEDRQMTGISTLCTCAEQNGISEC